MSSCDPPHWETNKRRCVQDSVKSARRGKRNKNEKDNVDALKHITGVIQSHLRQANDGNLDQFDISSLLETIPFVKMLADVNTDSDGPEVPLVTRAYEEQYMRQCIGDGEKQCVMKSACECMQIDPSQPFIGTAFIVPSETTINNGMCVLCLRKTTQMLFYKTIHCGHTVNAVIQKYGNICNEPNEYHPSAMLICPPNGPIHSMPLPIVAHQRNKYSVVERSGVLWVKQHNVYFEDFT